MASCQNRTRTNRILKYIRHNTWPHKTRYDKMMNRAFKQNSRKEAFRVVNHICRVMRKVGKKLMKRYNIQCEHEHCCLEHLIMEYRIRKLEFIISKRWKDE